jgi:hypothetical protein
MSCYICSATTHVQTYDDPKGQGTIDLCRSCAAELVDTPNSETAIDEPDDEFADACITAADYMRADGDY